MQTLALNFFIKTIASTVCPILGYSKSVGYTDMTSNSRWGTELLAEVAEHLISYPEATFHTPPSFILWIDCASAKLLLLEAEKNVECETTLLAKEPWHQRVISRCARLITRSMKATAGFASCLFKQSLLMEKLSAVKRTAHQYRHRAKTSNCAAEA